MIPKGPLPSPRCKIFLRMMISGNVNSDPMYDIDFCIRQEELCLWMNPRSAQHPMRVQATPAFVRLLRRVARPLSSLRRPELIHDTRYTSSLSPVSIYHSGVNAIDVSFRMTMS